MCFAEKLKENAQKKRRNRKKKQIREKIFFAKGKKIGAGAENGGKKSKPENGRKNPSLRVNNKKRIFFKLLKKEKKIVLNHGFTNWFVGSSFFSPVTLLVEKLFEIVAFHSPTYVGALCL